ncbi:dephospho-CoA kinase [Marivirga sp.]|uniref:dephospho-CoA kinase n=1 Tax=Marivirga sp. TaxID=2018662 RepID=UPI0025D1A9E3|nr:dephospho-CoA kinase [Marivirga sp.]
MKKLGITGGIGAGKSLICDVFQLLGIPNYPADYRAKWLQSNDPELKAKIANHFGDDAYFENGDLNRDYLSKEVFGDDKKLKLLNSLVHPAVGKDFENWCEQHSDKPYILKEAALLFETGSYKQLDATINVHANQELRLKRTLERDPQRTKESVLSIMKKQMSDEKRMELADYVIYNDESKSVIRQVMELHEELVI